MPDGVHFLIKHRLRLTSVILADLHACRRYCWGGMPAAEHQRTDYERNGCQDRPVSPMCAGLPACLSCHPFQRATDLPECGVLAYVAQHGFG